MKETDRTCRIQVIRVLSIAIPLTLLAGAMLGGYARESVHVTYQYTTEEMFDEARTLTAKCEEELPRNQYCDIKLEAYEVSP